LTGDLSWDSAPCMKDFLQKVVQNKASEAKWLHTLSLLEHIGARKISRSMGKFHNDELVLRHLADEARHAHAFKKLACTLSGQDNPEYLCGEAAVHYFQTLDSSVSDWIKEKAPLNLGYASYLLVTAVIEKRAMKIYPLYRSLTQDNRVRDELQQIIVEEADHKPGIEDKAEEYLRTAKQSLRSVEAIEEKLYHQFEQILSESV